MPCTVPVNVGLAIVGLSRLAFRSSAVCCAVETGLPASEVLLTLPSPTIEAVMPCTVPVNVGLAIMGLSRLAFSSLLPLSLPIELRIVSKALSVPAPET